MQIIILTGISGAGKSSAGQALEDFGYYKVDNMPVSMLKEFAQLCSQSSLRQKDIVYTVDIRAESEFSTLLATIEELKKELECSFRIIFLDASDEVIVARYKESRHIHPYIISDGITLTEALMRERKILSVLREAADNIIDTSNLRISQTRDKLYEILKNEKPGKFTLTCMTFGFKYGAPTDADLVFDVRCFANPHYDPNLRPLTGLDKVIRDFVLSDGNAVEFLNKLDDMISFLIPLYIEEGKSHLTVALGCTGGRHRSVTVAYELCEKIKNKMPAIRTVLCHRDIEKLQINNTKIEK
ncbi:MAG: RNase adapter RapZ [Ruminococcaceae bacterium]|nr:RNase adapter RapZ [Oscillospiraceae bacterium]